MADVSRFSFFSPPTSNQIKLLTIISSGSGSGRDRGGGSDGFSGSDSGGDSNGYNVGDSGRGDIRTKKFKSV